MICGGRIAESMTGSAGRRVAIMSNRRAERAILLAEVLAKRGVLRLREAAEMLKVSEMTVRRDIASDPDRFAYLGGHIVKAGDIGGSQNYEIDQEAGSHAEAKLRACANAGRLIEPDDTIFIDCGTTLVHLIDQIPDDFSVTAICYSMNVAERLIRKPSVRLILLGGLYHPVSASFSGGEAGETLSRFGINKAFLSAGGVDAARGVSCSNFHEVAIKQKAIASALASYLVVDTSKIGRLRPAFFAQLTDFHAIVTEEGVRATR